MPAASSAKKARQRANKALRKDENESELPPAISEPPSTDIPPYSAPINSFDEASLLFANSVTPNITLHHIWQAAIAVGRKEATDEYILAKEIYQEDAAKIMKIQRLTLAGDEKWIRDEAYKSGFDDAVRDSKNRLETQKEALREGFKKELEDIFEGSRNMRAQKSEHKFTQTDLPPIPTP